MSERKKVLVSGASSGIGEAIVLRFAQEGWDVCLNARREALLVELRNRLPAGNHLGCPGDYSDLAVVEAIGETIRREWGLVDVLVNSAGVFMGANAITAPLEEWRQPFDLMVNGG